MRYIEITNIHALNHGDVIRHKGNKITYTVIGEYGNRVTAVRIADVTNPSEWELCKLPSELKSIERGAGDDYPVIEPQNWK